MLMIIHFSFTILVVRVYKFIPEAQMHNNIMHMAQGYQFPDFSLTSVNDCAPCITRTKKCFVIFKLFYPCFKSELI